MSHGVWLVVCLVTGVKQTKKQTNNRIPLHSVPECPNSARIKGTGMKKNSRPSCQILFHQIPVDSARMTGFLQELGGH